MNINDIKRKNLVLIKYLETIIDDYVIKPEYSTDDNDIKVITVQEQSGKKIVFTEVNTAPLFNYYMINIYGESIREQKDTSVIIGNLIGRSEYINITSEINGVEYVEMWQIIFKQYSTPQAIAYEDIRRVGYTATMQCVVNLCTRKEI